MADKTSPGRKPYLVMAVAALLLVLAGAWVTLVQFEIRSSTFAGPSFHSRKAGDCGVVFAKLADHLREMGFGESAPPPYGGPGGPAEGARRMWFEKPGTGSEKFYVSVDLEETAVRTRVMWEIRGIRGKVYPGERDAYQLAITLDDWIKAVEEPNTLPVEWREEKRRGFERAMEEGL